MNCLSLLFKLNAELNRRVAKNLILFLGDGMSITTLAATRSYLGQKYGHYGEEIKLSFEVFPFTGLAKVRYLYFNLLNEKVGHHLHTNKMTKPRACLVSYCFLYFIKFTCVC